MKKIIAFFCSLLTITSIHAQMQMEGWRTHFSYNHVSQVEHTPSKIFAVSDGSLFSVDKNNNSIETYSKINILSSQGISLIRYNKQGKFLFVGYNDGNIDLVYSDKTINVSDVKNASNPLAEMANDVFFSNNNSYISCGLGIVVLNTEKGEVTDTYNIDKNNENPLIKSTVIKDDSIYCITEDSLYVALSANNFLGNPTNWKSRKILPSKNEKIVLFNNYFYLLNEGRIYRSEDALTWDLWNDQQSFKNLRNDNDNIILIYDDGILIYNKNMEESGFTGINVEDAIYEKTEDVIWIGTNDENYDGLLKIKNNIIVDHLKPDGPASNNFGILTFSGGRIFGLKSHNRIDYTQIESNISGAIMILDNENWINIEQKDIPELYNLSSIDIDKNNPTNFYVTSWVKGLFLFKNDKFYSRDSEYLVDYDDLIAGSRTDNNGILWLALDYRAVLNRPNVRAKLNNGTWLKLTYPSISSNIWAGNIYCAENNYKWFLLPHVSNSIRGIFILDDKNNPANRSSHSYRLFGSVTDQDGNSILLSGVKSIAEDKDNNIWIGNNNGPIVFKNIENIFSNNYTVHRPKIPRNDGTNFADYLLENSKIEVIAVDEANRKWIGTANSGVYLMSADGLETICHFTSTNSPLPSNRVSGIAINNKTGEVFFATDYGLYSYKSDAIEASESMETLTVYPNPVRENFSGLISIEGLTYNSTVKITDIAGNLIFQTRSNGGIATWDGRGKSGERVSSGVYLAFGTSENGKEGAVGKIVIIK